MLSIQPLADVQYSAAANEKDGFVKCFNTLGHAKYEIYSMIVIDII